MTLLLPTLLGLALAQETPEPTKLVGTSRSAGDSALTITTTEVEDHRWLFEVRFDDYARTTIEQVVPTVTTCASGELAGGHALVSEVERCFNARLPEIHPTYFYEDKTRVRCVFGKNEGAPAGACKLQYTGWFSVSVPVVRSEGPIVGDPVE